MNKIGLFDYLKQAGKVQLHEQGTLSNGRYNELKSAQKMIKNYLKETNFKVDIYDAQTLPTGKYAYSQRPDSVYVEVTNLLENTVKTGEFFDKKGQEPVTRQIFRFIDKANGVEEEPLEKLKRIANNKFNQFVRRDTASIAKTIIA